MFGVVQFGKCTQAARERMGKKLYMIRWVRGMNEQQQQQQILILICRIRYSYAVYE